MILEITESKKCQFLYDCIQRTMGVANVIRI